MKISTTRIVFHLAVSLMMVNWFGPFAQSQNPEVVIQDGHSGRVIHTAISPDARILASCSTDSTIKLWDLVESRELRTLRGHSADVLSIAFSPDGQTLASASADKTIKFWNIVTGRELRSLLGHSDRVVAVTFKRDGRSLFSGSYDGTVKQWDVSTGRALSTFSGFKKVSWIELNVQGLLAVAEVGKTVHLLDTKSGVELRSIVQRDFVNSVALSSDGRTLAIGSNEAISLWDVMTGKEIKRLDESAGTVAVSFNSEGSLLASSDNSGVIVIWNVGSGLREKKFSNSGKVTSIAIGSNGKFLVSSGLDQFIRLWNIETAKLVWTLPGAFNADDTETSWLAVTPAGLFDGSPSAWNQILWRYGPNTFDVLPVEAFFSDYYSPGLLNSVVSGNPSSPPRNIASLDRRTPAIKLSTDTLTPGDTRRVNVRVEVSEASADKDHRFGSGARDIRLFRNGSLVKLWQGEASLQNGRSVLETTVPIVAGFNTFSAFAFNRDSVRSREAMLKVIGSDSLKRPGITRILAVGINSYANPEYNLKFSADDAKSLSNELSIQQSKLGNPVEVTLVQDSSATKDNILQLLRKIENLTQPEDTLIIFFSGHATVNQERFYLVPHDLGFMGTRSSLSPLALQTILEHSISDGEFAVALQPIDCRNLVLIIDSAYSGQLLRTKSMAQLAYDKGMFVLLSSQGHQVSFESEQTKHGYLTYALIEDGLKNGQAATPDGSVTLEAWLRYAAERVPMIVGEGRNRKQEPLLFIPRRNEQQAFDIAKLDLAKIEKERGTVSR